MSQGCWKLRTARYSIFQTGRLLLENLLPRVTDASMAKAIHAALPNIMRLPWWQTTPRSLVRAIDLRGSISSGRTTLCLVTQRAGCNRGPNVRDCGRFTGVAQQHFPLASNYPSGTIRTCMPGSTDNGPTTHPAKGHHHP
jgi:hypothetical protein